MNEIPILKAAEKGDISEVERLISEGVDIETQNEKGWSTLILAAFNQHLPLVKWLVSNGADVNHKSVNGTTVFMYAKTKVMETGDYKILEYLLNSGADINSRDYKKDWTVLQYVRETRHTEMEEFLLKNGAK